MARTRSTGSPIKSCISKAISNEPSEGCRRLPKVAEGCRRLPKVAEGCRRLPKVAEGCRRLPKVAEGCRRLKKSRRSSRRPTGSVPDFLFLLRLLIGGVFRNLRQFLVRGFFFFQR